MDWGGERLLRNNRGWVMVVVRVLSMVLVRQLPVRRMRMSKIPREGNTILIIMDCTAGARHLIERYNTQGKSTATSGSDIATVSNAVAASRRGFTQSERSSGTSSRRSRNAGEG